MLDSDLAAPSMGHNITFYLFAHLDSIGAPLSAAIIVLLLFGKTHGDNAQLAKKVAKQSWGLCLVGVAVFVFLFTWVGAHVVMLDFPLSMDEFGVRFQAEVLASGVLAAPVDETWRGLVPWFRPTWVQYHYDPHEWTSMYWPMFSALMVPFTLVGIPEVLPPLLAAGTLLLIGDLARRRWADEPLAWWAPVILLAFSPQFLVTAMTPYAMTGHLFFNTLWLWLYVRDRTWAWLLLPWVGLITMGVHQPLAHALFVLPFCVRILLNRRWWITLYVGAVYLLACALWFWWLRTFLYGDAPGLGDPISSSFLLPGPVQILGRVMNLVYLITWQHPLLLFFFLLALSHWRKLPTFERDLIFSIALSFGFFFFYVGIGGHGWGARHSSATLANFALLGGAVLAAGRTYFPQHGPLAPRVLVLSTVAVALLCLPVRLWQAHDFVRPYAEADAAIAAMDADFVIVEAHQGYYFQDLVRNDPWLQQRPIRLRGDAMDVAARAFFSGRGETHVLDIEFAEPLGIEPVDWQGENSTWEERAALKQQYYWDWYRDAHAQP